MNQKGKNKDLIKMYSNYSPFPGRYKKFFSEESFIKRKYFTFLIKKKLLNKDNIRRKNKLYFRKYLPDCSSNIRIIDIGCGTGECAVNLALAYPNAEVIGVDASLASLNLANKLKNFLNIKNLELIEQNIQTEFKNFGKFDLILCAGVLHHLDQPKEVLKNISKLMIRNKTILSLQIYCDYGRNQENHIQQGIRELFPDDKKLKQRINFIKIMDLDHNIVIGSPYGTKNTINKTITRTIRAIKTLFFCEYVMPDKDTILYDALVCPVAKFYKAEDIDKLIQYTDLKLVDFDFNSESSKKLKNKIDGYLKNKEKLTALKIKAKFIYPSDCILILKSL